MTDKKDDINQSTVDFSRYSDEALKASLSSVNAIVQEIEKRKAEGVWDKPVAMTANTGSDGTTFEPIPIAETSQEWSFQFLGSGGEYFPIWVSHFFLSILTLGLFTPWAKVRARKYFYSRTTLANHSFSYSGDPWKILAGRIILATGAIIIFLNSILGFVTLYSFWLLLLIGFPLVPFIIWKSAIFNFSNSSYRGIFFSTNLKLSEVYLWALGTVLKVVCTFGILGMTLSYQYRSFFLSHLQFGKVGFTHRASQRALLKKIFPLALVIGIVSIFVAYITLQLGPDFFIIQRAVSWIFFIVFLGVSDSITAQYLCDHLQLGPIQFRAKIGKWELARLYAKAGFLTFVTLGFAWPWVRIEILRYKLERIKVYAPEGALNQFTQAEHLYKRTAGGFATELFEFDLGI